MPAPTIPAPKFPLGVTRTMGAYAALGMAWNVYRLFKTTPDFASTRTSFRPHAHRPTQWSFEPRPVYLLDDKSNVYVFDAIFRLEHVTAIRSTEHPVQNGASITDHAFVLPERIMFEIGMSDAMDNFYSEADNGNIVKGEAQNAYAVRWASGENKSKSAYQMLKDIQYTRMPLTVITRLNYYENMLIEHMSAPDDHKTQHGLRCTVTMKQIMTAKVKNTTEKVSTLPHTTGRTNTGTVATQDPGTALSNFESAAGIQ
jgi:Dit-like tail protein